MTTVTLLGAGKMGRAFVDRWRESGRQVVVWNRTLEAARAIESEGVHAVETAPAACRDAEVVVSMLTSGPALIDVALEIGALEAMGPGRVWVDLSTVDVESSRRVGAAAAAHGVHYVRGAVSGTPPVVRAGQATLLLSAPAAALALAKDVLDEITAQQSVVGDAEEARVVKIAVNSMLGGTMALLAEALALAESHGIERGVFLDALDSSVVSSRFVSYKGAALRARDYAATFTTADLRKDMELARAAAASAGVALPVGEAVLARVADAVEAGYGAFDFLSLWCTEQRDSGLEVDFVPPTPS